ncbi:hypothetical protein ACWEK5_46475 [Rhodococcus koreensis]
MTLFLVRHHHSAERCPAQDPEKGAMILNHLSRPNVRRCGVRIRGEAVVRDEHTLYFIADADDEDSLRELGPFGGGQPRHLPGHHVRARRRERRLRRAATGE